MTGVSSELRARG